MYRNVYYDNREQVVHLWTWDELGKPIKVESSYEPYLYIESSHFCDATSIFNTSLKKVKFKNQFERNKFLKDTPIKRIFHNLSCEQEFLLSTYKDEVGKPESLINPLKVFWLDIETYSPDEFPHPEIAKDPINLITIYDSSKNHFYTWGQKPYKPKIKNASYFCHPKEHELLNSFLTFWENNTPDVLATWNGEGFDVPYIMNRLANVLGKDSQLRLSPVHSIFYRENVGLNKFGKPINRWYIRGVSNIDYLQVYVTFSRGDRESYSLNYIGEYEEVGSKTNYKSSSLASLSVEDWETFVDYNIQDVNLLVKLDEKLKYMNLVRTLSYNGFIPFEQALGKVSMITGAVAHQALLQGYVIPTFKNEGLRDEYVGGYVHEPERGLSKSVVSYDANSLYPNTIITLNISPETKIGKIVSVEDNTYTIRTANEKIVSLSEEKFLRFVEKEKLSVSKYNVLYTQKFKGVVPNLIDRLYTQRVEANRKIDELEKELKNDNSEEDKIIKDKILNFDTLQGVYKLVLNSIYGVFAQKYSPLFDIDHSASITLTGQAVAKQASEIVYQFAKNSGFEGDKKHIYKYGDTDSCYFSIQPILDIQKINLLDDSQKVTKSAKNIIDQIDSYINSEITKWAVSELKSTDPRFVFKQEAICDNALFMEKKRYILHIAEIKGKKPSKPFKYVGVEVARSSISKTIKGLIKNVIENIMSGCDRKTSNEIYRKCFEEFSNLNVGDVSIRSKISDYEKQEAKLDDKGNIGKGTPLHAKSAIHFNHLLKHLKLENVYEPIGSGMKIKYFYAARNAYNYKSMAFLHDYPAEFNEIVKVDYSMMFDKMVKPPIESVYEAVGWPLPDVGKEYQTDLFDLLC